MIEVYSKTEIDEKLNQIEKRLELLEGIWLPSTNITWYRELVVAVDDFLDRFPENSNAEYLDVELTQMSDYMDKLSPRDICVLIDVTNVLKNTKENYYHNTILVLRAIRSIRNIIELREEFSKINKVG